MRSNMRSKVGTNKINGWPALASGSLVDVVAPASKCPPQELDAGIKILESWGLRVRVSESIFADNLLHSNSDQERWRQLKAALTAKDSSAVWCARGGYGSMKLLPRLAALNLPRQPKVFLGLSDITSLNVFFNQKWKWPVLHSPILSRVGRGDLPTSSIGELKQVLFGEKESLSYDLQPFNKAAEKTKELRGSLVGGNWATLMAGIGTPYQLRPKGNILFLEDVGERGYRLDRFWEQLKQMGFMDQLKGIILGDFTEGAEPDGKNWVWPVLQERAASLKIPVYSGLPAGHGSIQRVLPLGIQCSIHRQAQVATATAWTGCQR